MEEILAALRRHPRGADVPHGLRQDMENMYEDIFAEEVFPHPELTTAEISSIVDRFAAEDPRLAECAKVANNDSWCREYQRQALFRFFEHLLDETRNTAADCVLPTGTGKTRVLAAFVLIASKLTDSSIPVITPSVEIAEQNFKSMCELGEKFEEAIIAAGHSSYKFRVRWVVSEGHMRSMRNELAALPTGADLQGGQQERAKYLRKITSGKKRMRAVTARDAFEGPQPDVLIYNFHKLTNELAGLKMERPTPGVERCDSDSSDDEDEAPRKLFKLIPSRSRVEIVVVDESHRLGTPTIVNSLEHFDSPRVFLLGATPLRADREHFRITREVIYYRPARWFEDAGFIKTTRGLHTFSYNTLLLSDGDGDGEGVQYDKETAAGDNSVLWRRVGATASNGTPSSLKTEMGANDSALIRAVAKCLTVLKDGTTIILKELESLRSLNGIPHQAMIVVNNADIGEELVDWIQKQEFPGAFFGGSPRAKLIHSNLPRDERRNILTELENGRLDVVVCIRMLIEGYSNNLLSVLGIFSYFGPGANNFLIQYMGRVVRLITMDNVRHLSSNRRPHSMLQKYFRKAGMEVPPTPQCAEDLTNNQRALIVTCADLGLNDRICGRGLPIVANINMAEDERTTANVPARDRGGGGGIGAVVEVRDARYLQERFEDFRISDANAEMAVEMAASEVVKLDAVPRFDEDPGMAPADPRALGGAMQIGLAIVGRDGKVLKSSDGTGYTLQPSKKGPMMPFKVFFDMTFAIRDGFFGAIQEDGRIWVSFAVPTVPTRRRMLVLMPKIVACPPGYKVLFSAKGRVDGKKDGFFRLAKTFMTQLFTEAWQLHADQVGVLVRPDANQIKRLEAAPAAAM